MYVSFIGNLVRDAEEKTWVNSAGEKKAFLQFTVAESTFFRGEKGTEFIACTSDPLSIAKFLTKGKRVAVCGNSVIERWEVEDGKPFSRVAVQVYDVKLL